MRSSSGFSTWGNRIICFHPQRIRDDTGTNYVCQCQKIKNYTSAPWQKLQIRTPLALRWSRINLRRLNPLSRRWRSSAPVTMHRVTRSKTLRRPYGIRRLCRLRRTLWYSPRRLQRQSQCWRDRLTTVWQTSPCKSPRMSVLCRLYLPAFHGLCLANEQYDQRLDPEQETKKTF